MALTGTLDSNGLIYGPANIYVRDWLAGYIDPIKAGDNAADWSTGSWFKMGLKVLSGGVSFDDKTTILTTEAEEYLTPILATVEKKDISCSFGLLQKDYYNLRYLSSAVDYHAAVTGGSPKAAYGLPSDDLKILQIGIEGKTAGGKKVIHYLVKCYVDSPNSFSYERGKASQMKVSIKTIADTTRTGAFQSPYYETYVEA